MEYERIHKVQNIKKSGSNNNSSRTSPTKIGNSDFVKNSLLETMDVDEQVVLPSLDVVPSNLSSEVAVARDNGDANRAKSQQCSKGDGGNLSAVYPVRITEDENLDYDSNASSSSFEFNKGEKSVQRHISRVLSRTMPSKWNDAEKWIMNKQIAQGNFPKKNALQNQINRLPVVNMGRVAPESSSYDYKHSGKVADAKRFDFHLPSPQIGFDKFCFVPSESDQACEGNASSQSNDLKEDEDVASASSADETSTATSAIRSVSMRDMGTEMTPEMTPIPSQEPSRTCTPIGATTPIRSPSSSTPRGAAPAPTPTTDEDTFNQCGRNKKKLSEEEQKMKTRREIVELGVQLGKMNIAAWASKAEQEKTQNCAEKTVDMAEIERVEFEKRTAAWEEVKKSKHGELSMRMLLFRRYKRDELEIQAWESEQKAKLEAELQRIEAKVEQVRAQAQSKLMKKIALARQRSEAKWAAAEARKVQNAEKTAAQAEYIRQTGRMPPSHHMCCGWMAFMNENLKRLNNFSPQLA